MLGSHSESVYVRLADHACLQYFLKRHAATAFDLHAVTTHQAGHAEKIQDWFINAVAGQGTETVEVRLVFELECPTQHAFDIRVTAPRKFKNVLHHDRGICGIERPIAVSILWIHTRRARRATFRVGLAEYD